MSRVASLSPALVAALVAGLAVLLPVSVPAPASAAVEDDAPLELEIESLSPSVVPEKGPIRIKGTVTNVSDETWYAVNVLPFAGVLPIRSEAELDTALVTGAEVDVGERVTVPGNFDNVGDLEPGQSKRFSVRLQQRHLAIPDDPGVYWFGVHGSGETPSQPRDLFADGRARTFLPQLPDDADASLALVAPVRHPVAYAADGSLADTSEWIRALATGGALDDAITFADAAAGRPVTWLVDPAVIDAVSRLVDGNPPRDLGPTGSAEEPSDDESGEAEADDGPSVPAPDAAGSLSAPNRTAARDWLDALGDALAGQERLALPYGDLDVAAAARVSSDAYDDARRRSAGRLPSVDLRARPAVAPLDGRLPGEALTLLPDRVTVLLDQAALPDAPTSTTIAGSSLRLVSDDATEGGPGPDDPTSPIALRQRLLAESAVRLLEGNTQTVVSFAPDEVPDVDADFFDGLEVPWLTLSPLEDLEESPPVAGVEPRYDAERQAAEIPPTGFSAAAALDQSGATLDDILPLAEGVADQAEAAALVTLSQWRRETAPQARGEAVAAWSEIGALLDEVTIAGQPVTLSSEQGSFSVTVVNGLEQPIRVQVRATTDGEVEITPPDPIDLAGGARATRVLVARARLLGLHQVELQVTDSTGRAVGRPSEISLRASQVSDVIWVIIAIGLVLVSIAIVRRLTGRVLQWRRSRRSAALEVDA